MNDLSEIIERFWTLTEERIPVARDAVAEMRAGKPKAVFKLKDAVHSTKGESQLLRLRACANLMESADRLATHLIDAPHTPEACDAISAALDRLETLCETRGGGSVEAEVAALDAARGERAR